MTSDERWTDLDITRLSRELRSERRFTRHSHGSSHGPCTPLNESLTQACSDDRWRPISTFSSAVLSRGTAVGSAGTVDVMLSVVGREQMLAVSLISSSQMPERRRCRRQRRQLTAATASRATVTNTTQTISANSDTVRWLAVSETLSTSFLRPLALPTTSSDDDERAPARREPTQHRALRWRTQPKTPTHSVTISD